MEKFRHGRVLFAGDAAHQVSPFGARGANSGIQDADNLVWKLALVLAGTAPESLLDSYDQERVHGADENILNSTRATDFITPKSAISKLFRNAVLQLAESVPFARTVVNSGRLSLPCTYDGSALNGSDVEGMPPRSRPGSPCPDAPVQNGWLLNALGDGFTLIAIDADAPETLTAHDLIVRTLKLNATDALRDRYLGSARSAIYLIRPDQHVVARWESYNEGAVTAALNCAIGRA
jgi:3-(3-hydroxy-phenyl)propionate hydroxylase